MTLDGAVPLAFVSCAGEEVSQTRPGESQSQSRLPIEARGQSESYARVPVPHNDLL
jgi:hypothetical protein